MTPCLFQLSAQKGLGSISAYDSTGCNSEACLDLYLTLVIKLNDGKMAEAG